MRGEDVVELQLRLAGFRGTVPDGDFGPGTELQVRCFQREFMGDADPDGIVGNKTLAAIDRLAADYPIDFAPLRCPCKVCNGFGQGRYRGEYRAGKPEIEAYHLYEYPGIHRMVLWTVRALFFHEPDLGFVPTSGYRCAERNRQTGRRSTNHHGKAVDIDVPLRPGEDKRDDMRRCDRLRGVLVETAHAQIGWGARNRKSLEPSTIAPTWLHLDVRCYDARYLRDEFFCQDLATLDRPL